MKIISEARKSQFIKNVTTLSVGTILGQLVLVLFTPFLTRLYSPEYFGLLAAFMVLVSSIAPAITGKYEVAMVLPRQDRFAVDLFAVAVLFSIMASFLFFVILFLFKESISNWLTAPELKYWLLLAPTVVFVTGLFNLAGYFANRNNKYQEMARSKIINAVIVIGVSVFLGILNFGFSGLLIGIVIGQLVALIYLLFNLKNLLASLRIFAFKRKIILAKRYAEYPIYNASTGLLDGITLNLPIILLAHYFPMEIVGFYSLVLRVISSPISFISSSVSQVNLKKIVDIINSKNSVIPYLYKVSISLFVFSLIPVVILISFGPSIFSVVFGEQWLDAGQIAQILVISLSFRFVSTTLSTTIGATNNNRYGALWKITAFISTLFVLGVIADHKNINNFIIALVLNDIALYTLYYYFIVKSARNPRN